MAAAASYQPTAYGFCLEMLPFCGSKGRKKERKQYFRQLGTHLNCIKDEILIDPACGTAGFLVSSAEYIRQHYEDTMTSEQWEHILTSELGSAEDYRREYGDTPFGLLIRKIAKLDHDAAMQAFSAFINDQSLNPRQIAFVHKIINYIEQNGYMESVAELTRPPFDKPLGFTKLFDAKTRAALVQTINQVKDNAVTVAA